MSCHSVRPSSPFPRRSTVALLEADSDQMTISSSPPPPERVCLSQCPPGREECAHHCLEGNPPRLHLQRKRKHNLVKQSARGRKRPRRIWLLRSFVRKNVSPLERKRESVAAAAAALTGGAAAASLAHSRARRAEKEATEIDGSAGEGNSASLHGNSASSRNRFLN